MAQIPHVFLPVRPNDFTVRPFRVHKRYVISSTDYSASGYTVQQGAYSSLITPISASKAQNDPRNEDGSYRHIIWQALNHRYYKHPYDPTKTFEHSNRRYTYKNLFLSCSIFSAPYLDYGDGIKPGSVQITGSVTGLPTLQASDYSFITELMYPGISVLINMSPGEETEALHVGDFANLDELIDPIYSHVPIVKIPNSASVLIGAIGTGTGSGQDITFSKPVIRLNDDGYGNIYDKFFITSSYTNRNNLVAYWGFNEGYKATKYGTGTKTQISIPYRSHIFEPNETSLGKNITFVGGVWDYAYRPSGLQVNLSGQSCISTHDRKEFNFDKNQDFTIAFWLRAPVSQSVITHTTNTIISKRGTLRNTKWGKHPKQSPHRTLIPTHYMSQSIENKATNIYPYHFEINNQTSGVSQNGKVIFKRSDGTKTVTLTTTGSVVFNNTGSTPHRHITVTKSGSLMSLYVNGYLHQTGSDVVTEPVNSHMLLFGSENIDYARGFSGSLDEIRFYNYAAPQTAIQTLADNITGSMYQTSIVGNVFYKNGTIVLSSLLPKYNNVISGSGWNVKYRNTHTIYENECLVRIKAGDCNMTMNPTALKSVNSDFYMNEMTGSLLKPYCTSVGLYNHKGELMAVGKLGQPLAIRSDVNQTIILRWDM